ncbi:hypothetical protein HK097_011145 [Rhizophlyctis rosea]|uniref:Uncharacterized protein n=1 Tax=Rhizophlyctis rosea TaxID=64517 RepID=A0AAD5S941_9FUNG|nr:hypothetical protein HK097_011145 [Rhizophlyctis rosea]
MSSQYQPTEHDGLRKDGQPDRRTRGHESDAHANSGVAQTGSGHSSSSNQSHSSGSDSTNSDNRHVPHYKPTEHGGLTKDGQPDRRTKGNESDAHANSGVAQSHNAASYDEEEYSAQSADYDDEQGQKHHQGNTGEAIYKPTEHDGLRKDGQPDGRVKGHETEAHATSGVARSNEAVAEKRRKELIEKILEIMERTDDNWFCWMEKLNEYDIDVVLEECLEAAKLSERS